LFFGRIAATPRRREDSLGDASIIEELTDSIQPEKHLQPIQPTVSQKANQNSFLSTGQHSPGQKS